MPRHLRNTLLALLFAALLPTLAAAGTLCGTVTDRQTTAPVAHAGIFLRTPAGAYTGIYGATDVAGAFCIANVPPATYDIEVRVDDYQVAYLRDVVVTGTTEVEVGASPGLLKLAAPTPNPARDRTTIRWTLSAPARVELKIVDLQGRFVRGWGGTTLPPGEHSVEWNLLDASGVATAPGLYFVCLETENNRLVRPLVRIR